ncbi:MAG: hypothetical protein ACRYFZ_16065 [Janthinobacterium lividum]
MKKLTIRSEVEDIQAYLGGHIEAALSPALERKLKRLETARDLLAKYGSRKKVVSMLVRLSVYTEMGSVCQRTAYRDVEDAMDIFRPTSRHAQEFYVDIALEKVFETREKALVAGDLRAAAAADKNFLTIIEKFMGDKEAIDWSKVQAPRVLVGFMPELLNVPLPDDLDAQVAKLLKAKRGKSLTVADAEEAQIVP